MTHDHLEVKYSEGQQQLLKVLHQHLNHLSLKIKHTILPRTTIGRQIILTGCKD